MELVTLCNHMESVRYLAPDLLRTIGLGDIYFGILEKYTFFM
jgi:hypothetical protein